MESKIHSGAYKHEKASSFQKTSVYTPGPLHKCYNRYHKQWRIKRLCCQHAVSHLDLTIAGACVIGGNEDEGGFDGG